MTISPEIVNKFGNFSDAFQNLENKRFRHSASNNERNQELIISDQDSMLSKIATNIKKT